MAELKGMLKELVGAHQKMSEVDVEKIRAMQKEQEEAKRAAEEAKTETE